jgi:hypothetical protein
MKSLFIFILVNFQYFLLCAQDTDFVGIKLLQKEFRFNEITEIELSPFIEQSKSLLDSSEVVYLIVNLKTSFISEFLRLNNSAYSEVLILTDRLWNEINFRNIFIDKQVSFFQGRSKFQITLYYAPCR